jgi:hypothetical protein
LKRQSNLVTRSTPEGLVEQKERSAALKTGGLPTLPRSIVRTPSHETAHIGFSGEEPQPLSPVNSMNIDPLAPFLLPHATNTLNP